MAPRSGRLELRTEDHAILLSARTHLSASLEDRLRQLLLENLDWLYIKRKSHAHHVYPLLYNSLKRFERCVPSEILSQMRSESLQNGVRNHLAREELLRVLRRLQEHGLIGMPFKGPALAESVYGDLSLRVFGDLDILVPPDQVLKAKAALMSLGYQTPLSLNRAEERLYLRTDCEYHFSRPTPGGGISLVEVHWGILPPAFAVSLDADLLWRNASEVEVEGARYALMSPANQFLAMCLHAWKHLWKPLQCICDLHEFLGRYQDRLDWKEIHARARALGCEKIVETSLGVVEILFDRERPPAFSTGAGSSSPIPPLSGRVAASIFPNDEDPASILRIKTFSASFLESRRMQLRYWRRVFTTPTTTDFQELSLPERLVILYWLFRPFRLGWKVVLGRQRL
jgi:hypothetical protein